MLYIAFNAQGANMCFSAEASLSSSLLLTVVGVASASELKNTKWKLLSYLPLIFAMQQLFEGISWLSLNGSLSEKWLPVGKWGFLIFAFVFWPLWMPVALLKSEEKPLRRIAMIGCLIAGILFAMGMLGWILKPGTEMLAQVNQASIQYGPIPPLNPTWDVTARILYITATCLPCLLSSSGRAFLFGLFLLFTWLIAQYFYYETASSAWCFFSAIASGTLYLLFKGMKDT